MKKIVLLLILLAAVCFINAQANTFSLALGAGIRNIGEKELAEEVYGQSNMIYTIDLGYQVTKSLQLFLHSDYLSVKGETTLTKEETKLTVIPIELGIRFFLGKKTIFPYLGAGGGYYMYKEENPIGTVDDKKIGFFAEGGFKFKFGGSFFIDVKIKHVFLKVDGPEGDVNLGGLAYMGGVGISF